MYKISVICPTYNCEKSISKTIRSIMNQTIGFDNIELIIVDDYSTDNTRNVINYYVKNYKNIRDIFLKKNTGSPSIPRNRGIDVATAPYLIFIDSDDLIFEDYCETLYDVIVNENADIVHCKNSNKLLDGIYMPKNHSKKIKEVKDPLSLGYVLWRNIFKTSLIKNNDIYCPLTSCEDGYFAIKAYTLANKIIELPNYYGYIYTVENEYSPSLTHKAKYKENFENTFEGYNLIKEYLLDNSYEIDTFFNEKIRLLLFSLFQVNGSRKYKLEIIDLLRNFELSLNYEINLNSLPLNFVNRLILNKHYNFTLLICKFANIFYNHPKIKNFIFKKFFNLNKYDSQF